MTEERIKELQEFVDDFKLKLKDAKDRYESNKSKTIEEGEEEEKKAVNLKNVFSQNTSPRKVKHKILDVTIYYII